MKRGIINAGRSGRDILEVEGFERIPAKMEGIDIELIVKNAEGTFAYF